TTRDYPPEHGQALQGEMRLVGPRPLSTEPLPPYSPDQARRHEVRPGITRWAHVNGRTALPRDEKSKLGVPSVDNHNLWLDMKILYLTVRKVFARDGISAAGEATMPKFTGNKQ